MSCHFGSNEDVKTFNHKDAIELPCFNAKKYPQQTNCIKRFAQGLYLVFTLFALRYIHLNHILLYNTTILLVL